MSRPATTTARAPRERSPDALGGAFIVLASLQFGGVVVLGKLVIRSGVPVSSFLAIRFGLAAAMLAVALAIVRKPLRPAPGEAGRLAVLGMVGYALEAGLFFAALSRGTAPAVTLLFFTYPVWVSLIALATGKGLPGWLLGGALACAVAGAGVVIVSGGGVDIAGLGVLFALGSALTFSLYLAGADAVLKRTDSLTGAMWVSASAAVALATFALVTGDASWPHGWHAWLQEVAVAAFTAGAFVCLFAGLRRLGAVRSSIVAATEPLAATVLAAIFLGDPIRAGTLGGGVLILVGAVAASLARRDVPAEPPVP